MTTDPPSRANDRVRVNGKFFQLGARKFHVKGLTYGPFAPNGENGTFASPEQTRRDLEQIRGIGANVLRLYEPPSPWFLDLLAEHQLKALVDIPWPKHLCFLDSRHRRREARALVRRTVSQCRAHPAVMAFSVVNEIPTDITRWSGVRRIEQFIDSLVDVAKSTDPETLCTFASFPPTEYLQVQNIDFHCFNVYLHRREAYEAYLARLQMLADSVPLVLGEVGMDSIREGQEAQRDFLSWQIESGFRAGLAGTVIFSYTDDWHRGGQQIEDWAFGLTTRDRQPKPAMEAVKHAYHQAPQFPLKTSPKVSIVVASYNGGRTLRTCLESLQQLNYPDYEVILVDDGSTDDTEKIVKDFPEVIAIHQENQGLSAARNAGIAAATGEIVAFTDSDCRADEDWLYYLVGDLTNSDCVAIGGHNFLPPEDSPVAAAVMASPGGPAHVMLTDREAEHIPGCNMAFYRWALDQIGGFDPLFRKAGDDVDVCWRLQQGGFRIGFSPAGFVWHYRRATVPAYLRQQRGYGEAEALLMQKHPEYFNRLGNSIWHGRIYNVCRTPMLLQRSVIYHGLFGSGFFQKIYQGGPATFMVLVTSLQYYLFLVLPCLVLSLVWPVTLPILLASLGMPAGMCLTAAVQAEIPHKQLRFWSRPLVGLLFFLQPIERGLARYTSQWNAHSRPRPASRPHRTPALAGFRSGPQEFYFWSDGTHDRFQLLGKVLEQLNLQGWQVRPDSGWNDYDLDIAGTRWNRLRLTTVSEILDAGKQNFRWRLESFWSLRARILFLISLATILPVASLLGPEQPWSWMLLSLIGMLAWFLDIEKQSIQQSLHALVDEVATREGLLPLHKDPRTDELE